MNPAQAAHIIRTTGARFSSRTPAGGGRAGNAALPPSERPRSQRPIEEKDFRRTQQEIDDAGTIVELSYAITRLLKSADGQAADIVSYSAATFLKRVGTTTINLVGANVAAYASLCNQWSKLGVDAPSREACARVARAVSDAEQPTVAVIEPWHVALFVGAFSRFSDGKDEKKAAVRLADAVSNRANVRDGLTGFKPQTLSTLVNGFSKWPDDERCRHVAAALAAEVSVRARPASDLRDFQPQNLSNLGNGFSKWPENEHCTAAAAAVAAAVSARAERHGNLRDFEPQALTNLVNAFSKWPNDERCSAAAGAVAAEVFNRVKTRDGLTGFIPQALSILVNGFSKWLADKRCTQAAAAVAAEVSARARQDGDLGGFEPQDLSNLVNGFSKWPADKRFTHAAAAVAAEVSAREGDLRGFEPPELSNLVNAFSKWLDDARCTLAAAAVAAEVSARAETPDGLKPFNPQHLAILANGFSKWLEDERCTQAAVAVAAEVGSRGEKSDALTPFSPQHLANLVNAISKWPDDERCGQAAAAVAAEVSARASRDGDLRGFKPQELSNLANAFSKWLDDERCTQAAAAVAAAVSARAERDGLTAFTPQALSNLVNGFARWIDDEHCTAATAAVAAEICSRAETSDGLKNFNSRYMSNLTNAFSKRPENEHCAAAAAAIAAEVCSRAKTRDGLTRFEPRHLSNLVNDICKWPANEHCTAAAAAITAEVCSRAKPRGGLTPFNTQDLSNLVNGISKWPDDERCAAAAAAVAAEVSARAERAGLTDWDPQALSNLVNGFSKWLDEECRTAAAAVAAEVSARATRDGNLRGFEPQHLSNLVIGFGKLADDERCIAAAATIAAEICSHAETPDGLTRFKSLDLASLAHGFGRWPNNDRCSEGLLAIARCVGDGGRPYAAFDISALPQFANALSRGSMAAEAEPENLALLVDRLRQLADHLDYSPDRLAQASALHIATIFKALGNAQLHEDLQQLAPQGLARLEALRQATDFKAENLETIGNLAAALLPLARSPRLRRHRRQTLTLLHDLQPVVKRKIALYLNHPGAGGQARNVAAPDGERSDTRCPALSIYQTLKTYSVVQSLWKRPYVEGDRKALQAWRTELDQWLGTTLQSARGLIERDLSSNSWNLIAQLEAETPLDALDSFMAANVDQITAAHPPTEFDVQAVLEEMRHPPRPPEGQAGLLQVPSVDMMGRPMPQEGAPEQRYAVLARLTGGALPVVSVQLPGELGAFMLARTLTVEGAPYRMDLFGGSRMKSEPLKLAAIFAEDPKASRRDRKQPEPGKLLAIPFADTAPDSPFAQLARKLLPYKESFYYFQRMMMASPPAVPGLGVHDHVLEGEFKLGVLPDRLAGEDHPFRLTGQDGREIALRPHDGCGFIKASLAKKMPVLDRVGAPGDADRLPAFGERRPANLPAQALQHYPRNAAVAREAAEKLRAQIEAEQESPATGERLFRSLTTGRIQGRIAVAVPSADDCVHLSDLPGSRPVDDSQAGGVLIGRAPYDKPNLRPFDAAKVKVAAEGDATAGFLNSCTSMQYSFVAQEGPAGGQQPGEAPMFFAKGNLIVVPDAMWPKGMQDRDLVMSAEDIKTHSTWTDGKNRARADTQVGCVGVLQATEIFTPGSLIAIPVDEQKKLDGDYDGDPLLTVDDRPALYEHVRACDAREQAKRLPSFKPPKSHTPAIDPETDAYQFGRTGQILSTKQRVLESYTDLQRSFLAQPSERQRQIAGRAIFGTFEGLDPTLKRGLREQLDRETMDDAAISELLAAAEREVETARQPESRQVGELLVEEIRGWRNGQTRLPTDGAGASPLDERLGELFPRLAEEYTGADDPRARIEAILNGYPNRMEPRPEGYDADDPVQSMNNFLSLGIKVGTDAYKSDTATGIFSRKAHSLKSLMSAMPGMKSPPYAKSTARQLNAGTFDRAAVDLELRDNPTLAAEIMQAAVETVASSGLLPKRTQGLDTPGPTKDEVAMRETEVPRLVDTVRARAEQEEPAITREIQQIAEQFEAGTPHLDRRLRSPASLKTHLARMANSEAAGSDAQQQLIHNAVRHVLVFDTDSFVARYKATITELEKRGYRKVSVTNWFKRSRPEFIGLNTVIQAPNGYRFEIQFHTNDSYQTKLANHDLYKQQQDEQIKPYPDPQKLEEYRTAMRRGCHAVKLPPDVRTIRNWPATA